MRVERSGEGQIGPQGFRGAPVAGPGARASAGSPPRAAFASAQSQCFPKVKRRRFQKSNVDVYFCHCWLGSAAVRCAWDVSGRRAICWLAAACCEDRVQVMSPGGTASHVLQFISEQDRICPDVCYFELRLCASNSISTLISSFARLRQPDRICLLPKLSYICHRWLAVKWFRGGFVFEAHRLVYHSTLGLRVITKKKKSCT